MNRRNKNQIRFISGIIFALTGAALMFFGELPLPIRIAFGIIGITLIATSKFRLSE